MEAEEVFAQEAPSQIKGSMDLVFAQEGFTQLKDDVNKAYDLMKEYYELAFSLKSDIENSEWKGETKNECSAFFDLVAQFHKAMLEEPLDANHTHVNEMVSRITEFLKGYSYYQHL